MTPKRHSESGNVFLIIMMGIALFAALMFTFSRGIQEGTGNLSKKQASMAATDIIAYAQKVERAVARVQRHDCSENDISFANDFVTGYEHTPAVADKCKVFNPAGGSISYTIPDENWLDSNLSANDHYREVVVPSYSEISGIGAADRHELIFMILWLKKSVCVAINDKLGITNPGGNPPKDTNRFWANTGAADLLYTGTFISSPSAYDIDGASGKYSACLEGDTDPPAGTYHFYHVLVAR